MNSMLSKIKAFNKPLFYFIVIFLLSSCKGTVESQKSGDLPPQDNKADHDDNRDGDKVKKNKKCKDNSNSQKHKAAGDGTLANPYAICKASQLAALSLTPADWHKHYEVIEDLDMTGYTQVADGTQFSPIGNTTTPFTGTFEGGNKIISNLTYNDTTKNYVGLFGYVKGTRALLKNIILKDVNISGNASVGGLAGEVYWANVFNCSTSGQVTGTFGYIGGLVGSLNAMAIVSSSSSSVNIHTSYSSMLGGLVGLQYPYTQIYNSFATGNISGSQFLGGLVGYVSTSRIHNSYATGNMVAVNRYAAGLLGYIGGGQLSGSFATGNATANWSANEAGPLIGGFATSTFSNNFFNSNAVIINTGGTVNALGGTGVDLAANPDAFQLASNAPLNTWDFSNIWHEQVGDLPFPNAAMLDENNWGGCASTKDEVPFAGGVGTYENPYLICSAAQLNAISDNSVYMKHKAFKLMADISLSSYNASNFNQIGSVANEFNSVFDGNGKVLSDLSLIAPLEDNVGLFANSNLGIVKNLGIENFAVQGKNSVGALAGTGGLIISSYVRDSTVTASAHMVGGIAGAANYLGASYSDVTLTSPGGWTGGLVGYRAPWQINDENNFSVSDMVVGGGGPVIGLNGGITQNTFYDSSKTCTGCSFTIGTGVDSSIPANANYFFTKTSAPLNTWDFDNTWEENNGALPNLRSN